MKNPEEFARTITEVPRINWSNMQLLYKCLKYHSGISSKTRVIEAPVNLLHKRYQYWHYYYVNEISKMHFYVYDTLMKLIQIKNNMHLTPGTYQIYICNLYFSSVSSDHSGTWHSWQEELNLFSCKNSNSLLKHINRKFLFRDIIVLFPTFN